MKSPAYEVKCRLIFVRISIPIPRLTQAAWYIIELPTPTWWSEYTIIGSGMISKLCATEVSRGLRTGVSHDMAFKKPLLGMARLIPALSGLGGIIYLMFI